MLAQFKVYLAGILAILGMTMSLVLDAIKPDHMLSQLESTFALCGTNKTLLQAGRRHKHDDLDKD